MYSYSEEEPTHMLRILKFINEIGGHVIVSPLESPLTQFGAIKEMLQDLYDHEVKVSASINDLIEMCLKENDYATHSFI